MITKVDLTYIFKKLNSRFWICNGNVFCELALEELSLIFAAALMTNVIPKSLLSALSVSSIYFLAASSIASMISCCKDVVAWHVRHSR